MHSTWISLLPELAANAARQTMAVAPRFLTSGHIFLCIDRRCIPVSGPHSFELHPILGGHINDRNGVAIKVRLEQDAFQAQRVRKLQLVIIESHSDCLYCRTCGVAREQIWRDAESWLKSIPNTVIVRRFRDTATGALTYIGPRDAVAVTEFGRGNVTDTTIHERLFRAGFADPGVINDLATLIQGNLAYLRRTAQPLPEPVGLVIGTGVPRAGTHFSVTEFETNLQLATEVAFGKIIEHGVKPEVAVVITRRADCGYTNGECLTALRFLEGSVRTVLSRINGYGALPIHAMLVEKGTGKLTLVEV